MSCEYEYEYIAEIEPIGNGFVANHDGSKLYYQSLAKLADANLVEPMRDADKYIREHEAANNDIMRMVIKFKPAQ